MKKLFTILMIMVMVLANVPMTTEAKTKVSITVTNKSTGKKVGKKLSLKTGQKIQLKVKYGKKTVTKKAKYKTSAKKVVTVTKKGKITAKSAGTCTVKVIYKKKTKKIKVTVKEPVVNTEEDGEKTTEEATTEETKPKYSKNRELTPKETEQFLDSLKLDSDPHPECEHDWHPRFWANEYIKIDGITAPEDFADHLTLESLWCSKCYAEAKTKPILGTEALTYTQEELIDTILYFRDPRNDLRAPKHKCVYYQHFVRLSNGRFAVSWACPICGDCPI